MPVTRLGTGLTLLFFALSACSSGDTQNAAPPSPASETADSTALDLRGTWKVTVPGVPRTGGAADATAVFRASHKRGGLTFTDGCNSTTGWYAENSAGDLRLRPKATTLVGCPVTTPPVLTLIPDVVAAERGPNSTVLLTNAQGETVMELSPTASS